MLFFSLTFTLRKSSTVVFEMFPEVDCKVIGNMYGD